VKKREKKLNLTRETVKHLDPEHLKNLGGQLAAEAPIGKFCMQSINICSHADTCASCNGGGTILVR
jgi:hypothetical protein